MLSCSPVAVALLALLAALAANGEVQIEELDPTAELPADISVHKCIGLKGTDCDAHIEKLVHAQLDQLDDSFKASLTKLSDAFDEASKRTQELDFGVELESIMAEALASVVEPDQVAIDEIEQSVDDFCTKVLDNFGDSREALISHLAGREPQVDRVAFDALNSAEICNAQQKSQLDTSEIQQSLMRKNLYPKFWPQLVKTHEKVFAKTIEPGAVEGFEKQLQRLYQGHTSNLHEIIRIVDAMKVEPNRCVEQAFLDRQRLIRFYDDYPVVQEFLARYYIAQDQYCKELEQLQQQQVQEMQEALEQQRQQQQQQEYEQQLEQQDDIEQQLPTGDLEQQQASQGGANPFL